MEKPDELSVREATREDVDLLAGFTLEEAREAEGRVLDPALARRAVEAAFSLQAASRYWIASRAAPVGSASVTLEWSDWNAGHYWWLQSVYVVPEARGSGVVGRLVEEIVRAARAAGAVELRLLVHGDNQRAIAAYRRDGFEPLPYQVMRRRL